MKSLFILLAILFSNSFVFAHDVPMAVFHISETNNSLQINITFDLEDFCQSADIQKQKLDLEKMQNYLGSHASFKFNSLVSSVKILDVKIVRDHIRVKGVFDKTPSEIRTLEIKNDCLIDISRHSNIVKVDLNNKSRDFRMHRKRTEINLNY